MELIGRERELDAVGRALEGVCHGGTRVVGVLAEAGLGKSALLAAIARRARSADLLVLDGRGAESEQGVPFGVAIDALGEHVAAEHVLDARAPVERFRHHRALRRVVERLGRERPVALLLDDLHWADEASIEFVEHLLRRPPAVAHLLVFALRPVGPAPRLLDAARAVPDWQPLALEPLGRADSLALLHGVADPDARERIAREAAGNPLYLRELARVADRDDGALPSTLVAAVGLEVAALEPASRALIQGGAVAGHRFDPELAATAGGVAPEAVPAALDRLVAAGLVRQAHGRTFEFRHPLVRRAVYDGAAPSWRLAAHERAAAGLEERGAAPTIRAYHVSRCSHVGDMAAVALLSEAAEAAAAASPADAAHWYAAALRLLPDSDRGRRVQLLARMAAALVGVGRHGDAREALLAALALAPGEVELVVACARVETQMGRHAEARRRLLAARFVTPGRNHAALAFELAAGAFHEGRIGELREWAERASQAAADVRDPLLETGADALAALGAVWTGDPAAAAAAVDRATAGCDELADDALAERLAVALYVGVAQKLCERFAAARATSIRALAIARRSGQSHVLVMLFGLRAISQLALLELDAALGAVDSAEEVARLQRLPHLLHFALWIRALIHDQRGETAEAERAAHEAAGLAGELEDSKLTRTAACDFAALVVDRDPQHAMHEMVAAAGPDLEAADPSWRSWLLVRMVRAAIATGRLDEAERLACLSDSHTARLGLPAGATRAAVARAEVLLARGRPTVAAALAERAATRGDRAGAALDALEARLLAGRALAAAGEVERGKATLQRAAAEAGAKRARRLHDAAARELRRHGTRLSAHARHATGAYRDSPLTQREREVAELVIDGHSNKQIAAALYLSEKTVENTLTRIYAKLGVRSRVQLVRTSLVA